MLKVDGFFQSGNDCDPGYMNVRDLAHHSEDRVFVESLWQMYRPYADTNFRSDARHHFNEQFWEMYLGCTLLEHGFRISSGGSIGPEFYSTIQHQRCWFEAIAPSAGCGPDAVPDVRYGAPVATQVPADEIILRLRHGIHEKHQKYSHDCKAGVVVSDEPYIIGINSKRIRTILSDPEIPFIVKSVLPFGDLTVVIDIHEHRIVDSFHSHRDVITKQSGSPVSTDVFENPVYAGISAVLYSNVDAANYPDLFGADFKVVHNPMAANPIPRGILNFGVEYWVEDGELVSN